MHDVMHHAMHYGMQARQRYDYLKTVKKQKGYVQLQTSHGSLNLELHARSQPVQPSAAAPSLSRSPESNPNPKPIPIP